MRATQGLAETLDPGVLAGIASIATHAIDPSVLVGVVSVGTAAVTTAGGVLVALLTSRREAENAADDAMELTLRERLTLRDEQIAALEQKVRNRDDRIERLEAELAAERRRK